MVLHFLVFTGGGGGLLVLLWLFSTAWLWFYTYLTPIRCRPHCRILDSLQNMDELNIFIYIMIEYLQSIQSLNAI